MSKVLNTKIDFMAIISAKNCNPNGDPLGDNRPRTNSVGHGIISGECIKRKIRNRMQDMGHSIFVQSNDRATDGYRSLSARSDGVLGKATDPVEFAKKACETFIDVRTFGQVFALGKKKDEESGVSIGITGPVSIHVTESVLPVDSYFMQITKSVNSKDESVGVRASDTMGQKFFVEYGVYVIKGSMNVLRAEKTGFTEKDADIVIEALRTLFVNDATAARPDGSMQVHKLIVWRHNCKIGQYSTPKVFESVQVLPKFTETTPRSIDDYDIVINELPGLVTDVIDNFDP